MSVNAQNVPTPAGSAPAAAVSADVQEMKRIVTEQQKQLSELRQLLLDQRREIETMKTDKKAVSQPAAGSKTLTSNDEQSASAAGESSNSGATASDATPAAPEPVPTDLRDRPLRSGEVANPSPRLPHTLAAAERNALPQGRPSEPDGNKSPLQIRIGNATITPVGFMDLTNTFRSTNSGTSLQTNFGNIPFNNTVQGRLTEDKFSAENSRVGIRVDANYKGKQVLGYVEADFVGGQAANNTQVSSNSVLLRMRQYFVDVRQGFWEVLGGQAWSLLLPNRRGMSPLPADLFYTKVIDVNYINGLFWGRIPGIRFIGHPSKTVAFGVALENSTQYFGGSGGGGVPTLPAALAPFYNFEVDFSQVNDRTLPNYLPDIIGKVTYDPSSRAHFEIGGLVSSIRLFNPLTQKYFTKFGLGGTLTINVEPVKGVRLITANYWNEGGGRYLFGAGPDFIIRANGSPSLMHSASTVSGVEATKGKLQTYAYYGGVYVQRNTAIDTDGSLIGYGYTGSPNSQNRSIQEITGGFIHTLWENPRYGSLQWMAQYMFLFRNPWFVASGAPKNAHQHAVFFNLRYTLPGSAPTVRY